ncbi:MAG TPA: hypothetical protein VFS39_02720 [Nitrospira sp.]|nr:hypothetical protein [Nitrospira sp.]
MTRNHVPALLKRTGFAILICAVLTVAVACSSTSKIAQSSKGNVYLEEVEDWSFEASHPAMIDEATMLKIVKGLYSDEGQNASSRPSVGGGRPMRIFSDEDAQFIAPLLAQGLSKAKPEQIVGFRVSSSAGSGSEPTTGTLYVKNDAVYVTIAKGTKPSGFMPESVAHVEHAPSYAAGGSAGLLAMVIDYHALAKAPASTLPVAKVAPKPATALVTTTATPGAGKIQPTSSTVNASFAQNESVAIDADQVEKIKETLAKKDTEISMLRRESEWMKRALRDRDEEIKALRASKVSSKPASKKKQAEVSPTR